MPKRPADEVAVPPSPVETMVPPNFVVPIQSVQAVDGQELRLPCKVKGKPMPQISWYHNGKNIDQDEEFVVTYNPDTGDISLLIVEVFPEDEGEYVCVAHNPAGDAVTRATLAVIEPEQPVTEEEPFDGATTPKSELIADEAVMEVECVPDQDMEIEEEDVKPEVIERPKLVPLEETKKPRPPSPQFVVEVQKDIEKPEEEMPPEVTEETAVEIQLKKTEPEFEVVELEVKPDLIERPKVVPLEETKPVEREPSPEFVTEITTQVKQPEEEFPTEVTEETSVEVKLVKPTPEYEVVETELTPDVIERLKVVPLEETKKEKSPSPDFVVEIQKQVEQPKEEAPQEVTEETTLEVKLEKPKPEYEVVEIELTPDTIERPKVFPLEETKPRAPSPDFFEAIPVKPEEVPVDEGMEPEAEEEILEPTVKADKIDRPKPKSIVQEKRFEEPDFDVEIVTEPQPEEPEGEAVNEETLIPDEVTKDFEIPELKPEDETLDKKKAKDDEEAPREREGIIVEDMYEPVDEGEMIEQVPPEFVELLQPQVVNDGDKAVLRCKVIGTPLPSITWFREGAEISPSSDFMPGYDTANGICSLEIPEVFPEDAGEYACRAVNPYGEAVTTANLLVEGNFFGLYELYSCKKG